MRCQAPTATVPHDHHGAPSRRREPVWTSCHTFGTAATSPTDVARAPPLGAWHHFRRPAGSLARCLAPFWGGPPLRPGLNWPPRSSYDPRMAIVLPENEEAQRAWDGVLFDRFVRFKHLIVSSLALHGAAAMGAFPPAEGNRVLDIGCGFGDTTLQLGELVGPSGSALGVDVAPRFIEAAEADARELGATNVRFGVADVQAAPFDETFDYAFSRFGTMFFASPVAGLRNVRTALAPG